mmetsp:Transcript_23143/g.60959  ORF Transcript_23143/g.60959 Transcript_23143/m.60959 type:complete len:309 (-) Transcript_23143:549-1475(-)
MCSNRCRSCACRAVLLPSPTSSTTLSRTRWSHFSSRRRSSTSTCSSTPTTPSTSTASTSSRPRRTRCPSRSAPCRPISARRLRTTTPTRGLSLPPWTRRARTRARRSAAALSATMSRLQTRYWSGRARGRPSRIHSASLATRLGVPRRSKPSRRRCRAPARRRRQRARQRPPRRRTVGQRQPPAGCTMRRPRFSFGGGRCCRRFGTRCENQAACAHGTRRCDRAARPPSARAAVRARCSVCSRRSSILPPPPRSGGVRSRLRRGSHCRRHCRAHLHRHCTASILRRLHGDGPTCKAGSMGCVKRSLCA